MMPVNSETTPETDIAETLSQNTGNQIMRDKFDELAYTFWSIRPKDIPVDGTMPDNHPGGFRAWFYAQEMRAALPGMVVPLRWEKSKIDPWDGDYHTVPTRYNIRGLGNEDYRLGFPAGFSIHNSPEVAKAAAQARHVAQSLSAFGITPPDAGKEG